MRSALIGAIALCLLTAPVAAQELSDDELLQMFQNQRAAFRAARESGTGRTRGLTLVTLDNVDVTTESPTASAPAPGDTLSALPAPADGDVSITGAPATPTLPGLDTVATADQPADRPAVQQVVFGDLAPELQINVHIKFDFDSAALNATQTPLLAQLCKVMGGSDIDLFRIVGHTDASGSDVYNEKLSQLRANEVQRYLVNDCGIDPARLEAVGLGERFLANESDPDAGENRRVEFQALS